MTKRAGAGWLVGVAVGAVGARAAYRALRRASPGGTARWERINHRGRTVTLLEGPAFVVGSAMGGLAAPAVPPRQRTACAVALLGAGLVGAYDDLDGAGSSKGFRGHLGALSHGEVTSGTVKIAGIGASGLLSAALLSDGLLDTLIGGAVVAGTANLVNLLDLRPGRALKAGLTAAALLAPTGSAVAAPTGAAIALLGSDLAEEGMLGDCGANAFGAVLGAAALGTLSRPQRLALLALLVALTAASERVSFTSVIERTPVLRALDALGRRPSEP